MAAGATQSQRASRKRTFFRRLAVIARAAGYTYTKPRGEGPTINVDNFHLTFDMSFSNASNGETFVKKTMALFDGNATHHFHNWTWNGDPRNSMSREFWHRLDRQLMDRATIVALAHAANTSLVEPAH